MLTTSPILEDTAVISKEVKLSKEKRMRAGNTH